MNKPVFGTCVSLAVLLSLTACSSPQPNTSGDSDFAQQLQAREAALATKEAALAKRESNMNLRVPAGNALQVAGGEMLPPNAAPGQCFTRVWMKPEYKGVESKRLVSEASERLEIVPAKYGKVTRRVLVQEESTRIETIPATYKTVSERVMVEPAKTVTRTIAPVYETVTERVLDKPAHTTWKKGTGPIQRIDASTGEIMCLVEVPATYKTIEKQVLKTPARTTEQKIPAVYKVVKRQVVDREATTRTIKIPAKYTTVTVSEEVQPQQERRIPIPAKYAKVTSRELVSDGRMEWREILCETNTTPDRVVQIQKALQKEGFNPGAADGQLGPSTIRAVNAFQRSRGLPVDNYLNIETVKALGVSTSI